MTTTTPPAVEAASRPGLLPELIEAEDRLAWAGPAWVEPIRREALLKARALGLPHRKDEEWRYTNPRPILETPYTLTRGDRDVADATPEPLDLDSAARLVFVDGVFAPDASEVATLPEGVTLAWFDAAGRERAADEPGAFAEVMRGGVAASRDGFEALGAGLATHGAFLRVAEGVVLERAIVLVFRTTDPDSATLTAPQLVVLLEPGSRARVVEDHQGVPGVAGLTLGRTNLRVDRDARLEHAAIQREPAGRHHVHTLRLVQQQHAFARTHRVLLGGSLVRHNIHATLEGEYGEAAFNGLFLPEYKQHHDNHVRVEHTAPHCHSRQYYRGLLADEARGVFTGRIYVEDKAQKTDAIQSNANLLLSPAARVTAKPQLEIYADDVRCTHGATSGELDEQSLFYLRARGIPERAARLLLLHAFAGENLDRIDDERLREAVRGLVNDRLDAALLRGERA